MLPKDRAISSSSYPRPLQFAQKIGRLEETEASYKQSIALKPDFLEAHCNLDIVLYNIGNKDAALKSIEKANEINQKSRDFKLLFSV